MSTFAIFMPRRLGRLIAGDALNIARDPMLVFATVMSIVPSIAFYFAKAPMDAAAEAAFGIAHISRHLIPIALLVPAFLLGWVTGFLLLEDRDEGTLLAVDVTPVGKSGFLAYRVAITAVLAMAITLFAWPLVIPEQSVAMAVLIAILVGANAVAAAVALPAIARNKVEGLAVTKLTNLVSVLPLAALIPSPFRFIAGIVPTYWVVELLGLSSVAVPPLWITVLLALATHCIAIAVLFRLFARKAG
jgi:hypothetical protein